MPNGEMLTNVCSFLAGQVLDIHTNTIPPSTEIARLSLERQSKLVDLAEETDLRYSTLNPSSDIRPTTSARYTVLSGVLESARSRFDRFWGSQRNDGSL